MGARRAVDDSGWVHPGWSRWATRLATSVRHPVRVVRRLLRRQRGTGPGGADPVSADDVLERLAVLPLSTWTYGYDHATVRHLGPMAQDFAAAFGLGDDERRIDLLDANGVVMAATQALHRRVVALEAEVATLRAAAGADEVDEADEAVLAEP